MYFQRTSLSKNIFLWYDKKESYFCEEKSVFISGYRKGGGFMDAAAVNETVEKVDQGLEELGIELRK